MRMQTDGKSALQRLLTSYGDELYRDVRMLESLLHDCCDDLREISLLVQAARLEVPDGLRAYNHDPELATNRLSSSLHNRYGVDLSLARWAIGAWAEVLGVAISGAGAGNLIGQPAPGVPTSEANLHAGECIREPSTGMQFVWIPAGKFRMGSPKREPGRFSNEGPRHHLLINRGFWMAKYVVTQAEWVEVMRSNPSCFTSSPWLPVESVSWHDVQVFLAKLNDQTGRRFRLPSEAEWEYAARAGTTTPFYTGNSIHTDLANYNGNFDSNYRGAKSGVFRCETTEVGNFPANLWGLHDMAGNVCEWVEDCWNATYDGFWGWAPVSLSRGGKYMVGMIPRLTGDCYRRVLRGGSWGDHPTNIRSASRNGVNASNRFNSVGFRLVWEK